MIRRRIEIEDPYQPVATTLGQTILRIVLGVILTAHGWQKVMDYGAWRAQVAELGIPAPEIMAPLALAGELLGGLGLVFGLLTRIAAFGAFCVMAVAITTVHLKNGLFAQNGGFEFPLILASAAVLFLAAGPGPVSLDTYLRRRARVRAIQRDETWSRPPYQPVPEQELYDDERDERGRVRRYPEHSRYYSDRRGGHSSSRH
jgi:putative oxidoreductase